MPAKFGRARLLGERSLGAVDPGAMSVALLFEGFYEALPGTE
jgi:dihydroxyacetone kinase-like protein